MQPFSNQRPLKGLHNIAEHSSIHAHIHTPMAVSATQGDSQLVEGSQGDVSLLRDTSTQWLGGAGDRTSNLPVTLSRHRVWVSIRLCL